MSGFTLGCEFCGWRGAPANAIQRKHDEGTHYDCPRCEQRIVSTYGCSFPEDIVVLPLRGQKEAAE